MAFTVLLPPGGVTLSSPQGTLGTTVPAFTWNASSTATHYFLWVSEHAFGPRVRQWYTAAAAGCPAGTGTCTVSPGVELSTGPAIWWVQTWNAGGYGPWSNGTWFGVPWRAPSALSAVVLTKPYVRYAWVQANGATHYMLWVTDSSGTPRIQEWYRFADICYPTGTCEVVAWASAMTTGIARVWVQGWNPAAAYSPWSLPGVFFY
jgi:hypothetical protein